MKKLFLISPVFILAACSATPEQCDPSVELSFLQKIACTSSGTYDQRVQNKESKLNYEQTRNEKLRAEHKRVKKVNDSLNEKLNQKRMQVDQLNQSLSATAEALKQKAKGNAQLAEQIKSVEQQIQRVNQSGASDSAKEAELKALQRKLATYQKALAL